MAMEEAAMKWEGRVEHSGSYPGKEKSCPGPKLSAKTKPKQTKRYNKRQKKDGEKQNGQR